ncbi:hypothetical protein C7974DRAFT_414727 [Boeremia exigua]|uniref:uncharacterized protein n=1 Tax=Boeremia exigua TaxID=749465 RepID=UPI001E8CB18B|nr:uncharacterized protein C7974DRAFT_414727 [Boeremia exigua]KAH6622054.1 hypothetical protein C7974DRAFT_414727 [Boeremia exigua]
MKNFTLIFALVSFATAVVAAPFPQFPICTFDPAKGEYVCPPPPICTFDPVKGEYVCPTTAVSELTTSAETSSTLSEVTAAKCGVEGLHKCTRERQGAVCKNGQWEVIHRCATGQQCDMKEGKLCCRIRGPGFAC